MINDIINLPHTELNMKLLPFFARFFGAPKKDREAAKHSVQRATVLNGLESLSLEGDAAANFAMYLLTEFGHGVEKDHVAALRYLNEAANSDFPPALRELGIRFAHGTKGVEQSDRRSFALFHRAAVQEDPVAQYNLGIIFRDGRGAVADAELSKHWLSKAAENGDAEALYTLALENLVNEDSDKQGALGMLDRAASAGHALSQYNLGAMFITGTIVERNAELAAFWFQEAAERNIPMAQHNLAVLFSRGEGVELDQEQALTWFMKAAALGHTESRNAAANLLEKMRPRAQANANA